MVSAVVLLLIFLPIIATLLLSIDSVQNYIVKRASEYASEYLESKVSVGHIDIDLLSKVHIYDFYVEDPDADTLLYVDEAVARIASLDIPRDGLRLKDVKVTGAELNIREMASGELNIRPIVSKITKQDGQSTFRLYIDNIEAEQSCFRYERLEHRNPSYGIDYFDMEIGDINGRLENFAVESGVVHSTITRLSVRERSGFTVDDFTGYFVVDKGVIRFENLEAKTKQSYVNIPNLIIDGESWLEYKDYIDKVDMRGRITKSKISTYDLGFFAPALRKWGLMFYNLDGSFNGVVSDFVANVNKASVGKHTYTRADIHIIGLPEWQTSKYIVGVKQLHTTADDVELFMHRVTGNKAEGRVKDIIESLGSADVRGTFGGKLCSFHTAGNIATKQGNISADINFTHISEGNHTVSGSVNTDNLHLGNILGIDKLGTVDADITVSQGDITPDGILGEAKALVRDIGIDLHRFQGINISGKAEEYDTYDLYVESNDDDLNFSLNKCIIDFSTNKPSCEVDFVLRNANLHKLGINRRDTTSNLAFNLRGDVSGSSIEDIDGAATFSDIRYAYTGNEISSQRLEVEVKGEGKNETKFIKLQSDFVDLVFRSNSNYREIVDYLRSALKRYIPVLYDSTSTHNNSFSSTTEQHSSILYVETKERLNDLLKIFVDGLLFAPKTELNMSFCPQSNALDVNLKSEAIEYNSVIAADASLTVSNQGDSLNMWAKSEAIYLGARRFMPNFTVNGTARHNKVSISSKFSDSTLQRSGLLVMDANFTRNTQTNRRSIHIDVHPSNFTSNNHTWKLYATNGIDIDSSRVRINDLRIGRTNQELIVNGIVSRDRSDSLSLVFNNFDLSPLSLLVNRWGYELEASSKGTATLRSVLRHPQIEANIDLNDIKVNGIPAPPQQLLSTWDLEENRANAFIKDRTTSREVVKGYYKPLDQKYYAEADLEGVELSLIQPFLTGIVSDIHGTASGKINILGTGRQAVLGGSAVVDSLDVHVDYTNTRYKAPRGTLEIGENRIIATSIPVFDEKGNQGSFSMNLNLNHLSNIKYDITVTANDMLVFDTDSKQNDLFYGHVYASGTATFNGSKQGMNMRVEGTSSPNSRFYLPMSGKEDIAYADFVQFKEPTKAGADTTLFLTRRLMMYEREQRLSSSSESNMIMDIVLNVNPNVEMQLVIDPTVGDVIKGKGNGRITMHIEPDQDIFTMDGDYHITEGTYLFTLQKVVNKLFTVEPGSSIQWTGDPLDADINIDAIYRTKTSLKPLLGNSIEGVDVSRSVPVDCCIKLTGKLMKPDVSFDVEVTNVSPEIETIVRSILNDQQAIATQMLWLLTAGTFSAEDPGAMGASLSATTGFDLLSNQLSNWLSGDRLNILLRYRPRTNITGDEVDAGFSTSWLNNRLIVELKGGYLSDASSQATENTRKFIGEGFVTWLIDPDGTFKLKGFTQTIDRYGENQGMQESGVGIYFNKSFNTLSDLGINVRNRMNLAERQKRRRERREEKQEQREERRDSTSKREQEHSRIITRGVAR